jgi:hypothetical protein
MKSTKLFAVVALVALIAVGCGNVEKILPKKDGLWVGKSQTVTVFANGVQDTSYTETDSLGQMMFEKDGGGYSADYAGNNKVNFTWSVNADNDQVTVTDTSGVPIVFDVLESSGKEQTWKTSVSFDLFGITIKTDIQSTMERQ